MTTITAETKGMSFLDGILSHQYIILFSGKIRAGKTTSAQFLENILRKDGFTSIKQMSFAEEVKNCAKDYFNWDGLKDSGGRKLLQNIGSTGRAYKQDIWVDKLLEKIDQEIIPPEFIIIDDWRFPNEFKKLTSELGFYSKIVTVRVLRGIQDVQNSDDISEVSLTDFMPYDFIVDNTGTLDDLKVVISNLADMIYSL